MFNPPFVAYRMEINAANPPPKTTDFLRVILNFSATPATYVSEIDTSEEIPARNNETKNKNRRAEPLAYC